jgi:hypothetical protein
VSVEQRAIVAHSRAAAVGGKDLVIFAALLVVVLAITAAPFLFGHLSAPPDKQFMGIVLNVPDTAQYNSWAREFQTAVFIENKLTSEPGDAVFFNLFWFGVGRVSASTGLGIPEASQLVRLLAGAVYLGAIFWFVGLVSRSRLHRWVSFLVVAFGGGLGWGLVVYKQFSGDLPFPLGIYAFEANTFLTVMGFPLQAMSLGLMVLILGLAALAFERGSVILASIAGLLTLALGLQHGYDLLIIYAVTGLAAGVLALKGPKLSLRPLLLWTLICVWSGPVSLYLAYLVQRSPVWSGVLAQYGNAGVFTPAPAQLLILMGVPLLLVVAGRDGLTSAEWKRPRELVLRSWLVVGFALLYIPTDFQIKMLGGWQVPVGVLATRALFTSVLPVFRSLRLPRNMNVATALGVLLVLVVLPANLYLLSWRFIDLGRHDYPYYIHKDEHAALQWLEANSRPSEVVLSSLTIGQHIPGVSGNKALLAHWAQSLDFYEKRRLVSSFYSETASDSERIDILSRFQVQYVFHGSEERLSGYRPGESTFLEKAFTSPVADIYRVELPSNATELER